MKTLTMGFVGIVSPGLVSGSHYNGGGASDINASLHDIQFVPHREHPVFGLKPTICDRRLCQCLFIVG